MKQAKIEVEYQWQERISRVEYGERKSEKVMFDLGEVGTIEGRFAGNQFIVIQMGEEEIVLESKIPFSEVSETGTVDLFSEKRKLKLTIGASVKIVPAVTDVSGTWIITLVSIIKVLKNET